MSKKEKFIAMVENLLATNTNVDAEAMEYFDKEITAFSDTIQGSEMRKIAISRINKQFNIHKMENEQESHYYCALCNLVVRMLGQKRQNYTLRSYGD